VLVVLIDEDDFAVFYLDKAHRLLFFSAFRRRCGYCTVFSADRRGRVFIFADLESAAVRGSFGEATLLKSSALEQMELVAWLALKKRGFLHFAYPRFLVFFQLTY